MNNNINNDPMTGQPINESQAQQGFNTYQQPTQPVQPQQSFNEYQQPTQSPQPQQPKKNNKLFIIIAIIAVIVILVGIILFFNQDKKESMNNETPNNSEVEDNNSIGSVEEGTNTSYDENGAFLFQISDKFNITGRGIVVTGQVERGKVKVGDTVQIVGFNDEILTTEVTGIELYRKPLEDAKAGDIVGIYLKDITIDQVQKGQVLSKPNSIVASIKFDANVHIRSKEEGGINNPFFDGYKTQIYFRNDNKYSNIGITGTIDLPDDIEMVSPGEDVSFTVSLESNVAMEVGTEFYIREDDRTIGTGTITKVY